MKPLDQQLADLSIRARHAEEAIAVARKDTRERMIAQREEFRSAALLAADRVEQDLTAAGAALDEEWRNVKAKVSADLSRLKAEFAERQVELNVDRLADRADRKEADANVAIDFALASIENARLAVIDAVLARRDAEDAGSGAT